MELEHLKLRRQWEAFSIEQDKEKSKELLTIFIDSLLKHIHLEDGILSPTFNKYLNIEKGEGPTALMSSDHVDIIKLLDKVRTANEADDEEALAYAKTHFERAMLKHHEREEETHYVYFDKMILKEEWEDILKGKV